MQKHLRTLAVCLLTAGSAAPLLAQDTTTPDAAEPEPITGSTVVATINGEDITLGHMIAARAILPEQYDAAPPAQLYAGILQQLIQQTALAQSVENLPPIIALTLENEERSLKAGEALERELASAFSEEDVQAAYDEAFKDFAASEEYNASHILVPSQAEAQAIKDSIDAGADFAETAREKSTGPSGPNGGALGWFGTGMMVPPFEAATIALEVGAVSEPVETQFGWHVIMLNDVRKIEAPTMEQVRPQLEEQLRNEAARDIISSAADGAELRIYEDLGIDPAILTQRDLLDQ